MTTCCPPGRDAGAAAQEEDGEPFDEKMACLTATSSGRFAESAQLEPATCCRSDRQGDPIKESG